MNSIVRHYLPSVVRGVYRFDEAFSEVEDQDAFEHFVDGKLRFLPCHMAESILRAANIERDYERVKRHLMLPEDALDGRGEVRRRTEAFFSEHPYFHEALEENGKESDKYLDEV
jgi:hypothetical protein